MQWVVVMGGGLTESHILMRLALMVAAERVGIQLPQARRQKLSKTQRSRARRGQLECQTV